MIHCRFCNRTLDSTQDIISHYNDVHSIKKENSPTFENYIDAISRDQMFVVESCEYCNSPPFFNLKLKAKHYLCKHLKLLPVGRENLMIRKVGDKFIAFSIYYSWHGKVYNFKDPEKVLNDSTDNVTRGIPEANGEFRLVYCIVNQSAVELHGRRLYTNSWFMSGIVEGLMKSRVKEFLFQNTKKREFINGENGSNVYFYRFNFLKIHFLTSNLRNYISVTER